MATNTTRETKGAKPAGAKRKASRARPRRTGAVRVTDENFGELLVESLEQAAAIDRGELQPARQYELTARDTIVEPPPGYDAARVRRVRRRLAVSQQVFAEVLGVHPATVRAWEQGVNEPDGASRRLLQLAESYPDVVLGPVSRKRR